MKPKPRRSIEWQEFDELAHQLAIAASVAGPFDAVVGIARGGAIVGCVLSFLLGRDYYPIRLRKEGGTTRVIVPPPPEVSGLNVLLVDDLSQSGETFKIALHELAKVGATRVTTCALVRRDPGFRPNLFALEVDSKVRFPWARDQLIDGKFVKR